MTIEATRDTIDVRATIQKQIKQIASENGISLPVLSDKIELADLGLKSLDLADLIAALETELGFDPFFSAGGVDVPVTIGDFIKAYEKGPIVSSGFRKIVDEICDLKWSTMAEEDLVRVAWAYYHFSVQFRECLEIALKFRPDDEHLVRLDREERNTDNLSPWPDVAKPGEKMNHDEFMRRTLLLEKIPNIREDLLSHDGQKYLSAVRAIDPGIRAKALASYEDGGLEKVFRAILKAPTWEGPLQQAFKHFLVMHIQFDSDPTEGHGALCRHLPPDDSITPVWIAFRDMLTECVPALK